MQHCGNCGTILSEEELRLGKCAVCLSAVTPDIDTIPADSRQRYAMGQVNEPASQPFGAAAAGAVEQRSHVSAPEQTDAGMAVRLPAARPRRRGRLLLLGALALLILVATAAVLFINPSFGGKVALQSKTATTSVHATGAAGGVMTATSATVTAATLTGGATATSQPGGAPGAATATPAFGGTGTGGSSPTTVPAITATPLPTATQAPSNPPVLYMNPTAVRFTLCLLATSTSFTIKNTGGGALKWDAISSDYTVQSPTQGTLSADQYTTITVNGILLSGSVTVNATDLAGHPLLSSPQTFTVACTA